MPPTLDGVKSRLDQAAPLPASLLELNLTAKALWLYLNRLDERSASHSFRELGEALGVTHGAVRDAFAALQHHKLLLILGRAKRRRYRYRLNVLRPLGQPLDAPLPLPQAVIGAPLAAKVLYLWLGERRTVHQSGEVLACKLGVSVLTALRARHALEASGLICVAVQRKRPKRPVALCAGGLYG